MAVTTYNSDGSSNHYSNDGSRVTRYDSSGHVTGTYDTKTGSGIAGTSGSYGETGAHTVTDVNGHTTTQVTNGNQVQNVLPGSVFDPLSPNYNAIVANSGGKISLSDLDSSQPNGLSPSYNGTAGSGSPSGGGSGVSGTTPSTTPSYLSGNTFDTTSLFNQIQDSYNKALTDLQNQWNTQQQAQTDAANKLAQQQADAAKAQATATANQNAYNTAGQSSLNSSAQDSASTSPTTSYYGGFNPVKQSTGGATIKSNAISRYLAKDMWANQQ